MGARDYHRSGSGASKKCDRKNILEIRILGLAFWLAICENDFTAAVGERTDCAILKCGRIVAETHRSAESDTDLPRMTSDDRLKRL